MSLCTGRPESPLGWPFALPLGIAGEIDVLPTEWREVFQQLGIYGVAVSDRGLDCSTYTVFQSAIAAVTRVSPLAR